MAVVVCQSLSGYVARCTEDSDDPGVSNEVARTILAMGWNAIDWAALASSGSACVAAWMAVETRKLAKNAQDDLDISRDIQRQSERQADSAEASAQAARSQADFTSKIYEASQMPFVIPMTKVGALDIELQALQVRFPSSGSHATAEIVIENRGSGAALFGRELPPLELRLYHDANWTGNTVSYSRVLPVGASTTLRFLLHKLTGPRVVPATSPDGTRPGAVLLMRYTSAPRTSAFVSRITWSEGLDQTTEDGDRESLFPILDFEFEGPLLQATGAGVAEVGGHGVGHASEIDSVN
jgi:hypothetical protein